MAINSIELNRLRNGEYLQLMTDALAIVDLNSITDLKVAEPYNDLLTVKQRLDGLFKIETGNAMTAEIEAIDLRRDNAITGILNVVTAYTYHFNPATKQAANLLTEDLKKYGPGIARDNYQSETATLNSIVSDWKSKPELTAAVNALQLMPWVDELDGANAAWYALRDTIDAYHVITKGSQPFAKATQELNALIDQYNALLAGRSNKADANGQAPTPTPTPVNP